MPLKIMYLGIGCAFFIPELNIQRKFSLNPSSSVYTGETIAILKALEFANSQSQKKVTLLSDSLSALKSITQYQNGDTINTCPYIEKIKKMLYIMKETNFSVKFIWVKSHIAIEGNEIVDQLAKDSITTGEQLIEDLNLTDSINYIRNEIKKKWSENWKNYCQTHPNIYTSIQPDIPKFPWFKRKHLSRLETVTITRMRLGHACYPYHLNKMKIIPSNLCEHCNEIGDLNHIFLSCGKHLDECQHLYEELKALKINFPINISHLVSLNNSEINKVLMKFLKNINMKL